MANEIGAPRKKGLARFWQYLKETRLELKKITWPTHKESLKKTLLVIVVVVILGVVLWGFDQLLLLGSGLIFRNI